MNAKAPEPELCKQHEHLTAAVMRSIVWNKVLVVLLSVLVLAVVGMAGWVNSTRVDGATFGTRRDEIDKKIDRLDAAYDLMQRVDERLMAVQNDVSELKRRRTP